MLPRGSPSRILCINCNICVNKLRRYPALQLDPRVTTIICDWIHPRIVSEDNFVCEACRDLAIRQVNDNLNLTSGPDEQQPGSSHRGHLSVCMLCGCSLLHRQSNIIVRDDPTELQQSIIEIIQGRIVPRQISASDKVCHACWLQVQRQARRQNSVDSLRTQPITTEEEQSVPVEVEGGDNVPVNTMSTILLPNYRRAANSNRRCIFPSCTSTTLQSITDKLRAVILSSHFYYLPRLARVCRDHLMGNLWDTLYESENSIKTFTAEQIQHIFSFVNAFNPNLDFENLDEMDDRVFEYWMGIAKEKFNALFEEVPRLVEMRRGKLALASFLLKMRTGDSNERISTLVQVPRRTLEGLMNKVRQILIEDFVPHHLGINHLDRNELLQHNLTIPNGLYGNGSNAIVICDGTYIYLHKSSNYMFQKQSYSLHKYRNLLKPFMVVACDGYIIDCFGPYKATTSDAEIMSSLFNEGSALRSYFRDGDVFILDRGFRDSIHMLEGCGYRPYMPESLLAGEKQLTTAQANRSRCVTICRWVVEAVNGQFKRDFKIFRQEYFHRALPLMMQTFKIAAALLNKFGAKFKNNIYANEILEIIGQKMNLDNNLANMVEALNLNRRSSSFQNITAENNNLLYFPTLEYRDLVLFALGTYQIKQARSYYGEHVRSQGGYIIEVCSEPTESSDFNLRGSGPKTLIRGKIRSRHFSRKIYYVYILIEDNIPGRTGILEYCCSCLVGRRTVGCCAHVMTLVWYLGWARNHEYISAPAEFLDNVMIREDDEE